MKRLVQTLVVTSAIAIGGCQCVPDIGFVPRLDDAGPDVPPPPPPPIFPLKDGDILSFPAVQGRTEPCTPEGACQRAVTMTFTINDAEVNSSTGFFEIDADFLYQVPDTGESTVPANNLSQLFTVTRVPFELATGASSADTATFTTDAPPIAGLQENDFPFFHFETEYATQPGSPYQNASGEFRDFILDLDPEANIENQAAEGKFEAYFRDDRGGGAPMLHYIRVDLHPFGFVCGFNELLVPFVDGSQRNQSSIDAAGTPPLAGSMSVPIRLTRDDTRYICSCGNLNSRFCRSLDDQTQCLDPGNPDAAPSDCP